MKLYFYFHILSAYSTFSDRVGLPLHKIHIPSPFDSIIDIFFVDLKFGLPCGSGAFSLEEGRIAPLPLPRHVV